MPRIVHPGRDLVDDDPLPAAVLEEKHFDREHADIVERVGDAPGNGQRLLLGSSGYPSRHPRDVENVVAVSVGANVVGRKGAAAGARRHDRDLPLEGDEAFEDAGGVMHGRPKRAEVALLADYDLTLAVVAEA